MMFLLLSLILFVCFVGVVVGVIFMSRPNKTTTTSNKKTKKDKEKEKEDDTEGAVGEDDDDDIDIDFDDNDIDEFLDSGEEMEEDEEEEDLDTLLSRLETGMSGEEVDFDASSAYIQPDPVVVKNIERSDYTLDPMESWKVLNRSEGDIRFFVDRGITNKIKAMTEDLKEL